MVVVGSKLTFAEYLASDHRDDRPYELIDGVLTPLPPESELNDFLATQLLLLLIQAQVPPRLIKVHTCELQVPVIRPQDAANRYPDLVILRPEHLALTRTRLTITLEMPPPQLVAEVVSPGASKSFAGLSVQTRPICSMWNP
jgi:Uma2 family endonuclease